MPSSYRLSSPRSFLRDAPWVLPNGQDAFEGGRRALRAGFLDPARAIFQALSLHEVFHPEVWLSLAQTELAAGNPGLAATAMARIPTDLVQNAATLTFLADLDLVRGKAGPALSKAFLASELSPADPHPRFLMARLHWIGGEEKEAELAFLSLVGELDCGERAAAWAVFCGWRQGQVQEVAALCANLRSDDAVCEGLRQFGAQTLGTEWHPSDRVHPDSREAHAQTWTALHSDRQSMNRSKGILAAGLR